MAVDPVALALPRLHGGGNTVPGIALERTPDSSGPTYQISGTTVEF